MKWIKHMTETVDDEKIARLVSPGGIEGLARYGLYWRVNEIIARQMGNSDNNCSVCYPVSTWSRLLFTRGSLVFSALSRLAVTGERPGSDSLVTVEREGDEIRVTNRNLLKYRDEYSKKSRQPQENVPPRGRGRRRTHTEGDGEGEKGGEKIPDPPPPPPPPPSSVKGGKPSVGAEGELMAATYLLEEIGMVATFRDIELVAGVIRYAARDAHCDIQEATEQLTVWAKAAIDRGELVNVFWFKDRKFMQTGGKNHVNGNGAKPSIDEQANANLRASLRNEGIEDGPDQASDYAPRGGNRQSLEPGHPGDLGAKPAIVLDGKADWGL
jgi:hypothetical protein